MSEYLPANHANRREKREPRKRLVKDAPKCAHNTRESLDEAEELAIGNPELLQRIKKAKEALPSNAAH